MTNFLLPLKTVFSIAVMATFFSSNVMAFETTPKLRIATFNVSMEALNYKTDKSKSVSAADLSHALNTDSQQIKNIAEIIQRVNPDIILLNEFDRFDDSHKDISTFLHNYVEQSQQDQTTIKYPYFYQGAVNTGVHVDIANSKEKHGFGYFPGHFGMVLLSKYPILHEEIRTFQFFKWKDMPGALKPIDPKTNQPWYDDKTWEALRLSSKSHWDIPVTVNGSTLHVLASHPTPPVFDGEEDRNGKRNHDEIRFWLDYITADKGDYIYDDNKHYGGLGKDKTFVILGDLNASNVEGDAINTAISNLLTSDLTQDVLPSSIGGQNHSPKNIYAKNHTAYWRMRADYVIPSVKGITTIDAGVFWPLKTQESFRLIKDRSASSDHRLVWADIKLHNE